MPQTFHALAGFRLRCSSMVLVIDYGSRQGWFRRHRRWMRNVLAVLIVLGAAGGVGWWQYPTAVRRWLMTGLQTKCMRHVNVATATMPGDLPTGGTPRDFPRELREYFTTLADAGVGPEILGGPERRFLFCGRRRTNTGERLVIVAADISTVDAHALVFPLFDLRAYIVEPGSMISEPRILAADHLVLNQREISFANREETTPFPVALEYPTADPADEAAILFTAHDVRTLPPRVEVLRTLTLKITPDNRLTLNVTPAFD